MPDPLSECTAVQKLILCGLVLSPHVTLSRLEDVLRRIDTPLLDPKFKIDFRGGLRTLNGRHLVNAVNADGEILYEPVLSTRQLAVLAEMPEFQMLIQQKRKMLRMVYTGEMYRVSEDQKTSMSALLAAFILRRDHDGYERSAAAFSRYDTYPEIRQTAFRFIAGRTDSFPPVLDDTYFPELFPFLAWNSLMLGGSAAALLEKFRSLYPDHTPPELFDPLVFLLLWNGRGEELRALAEGPSPSPETARGALAFLAGSWETAWRCFSARLGKLHERDSVRSDPPMLLLSAYLAGILARRPLPELRSFPENIERNAALNSRNGLARFLAELLKSIDAVYRSGGKMDAPCDPEHLPVFCNMLKSVFLALTRKTPLPSACASAYFSMLERLEHKQQLLTASWMAHALAVISEEDSVERAFAASFDAAHAGLASFISPQSLKPRWQLGLDALTEILREVPAPENGGSGAEDPACIFSWQLRTRPCGGDLILESIQLRRHLLSPDGVPGKGRIVLPAEFASNAFSGRLTAEELRIRSFVKTAPNQSYIAPAAIEFLAGNPRVFLDDGETPVSLRKGENSIRGESREDGFIELSLRFRRAEASSDTVFLYREDDGTLCYVLPDVRFKRLNSAFENFGSGGVLKVPESEKKHLFDTLTPLAPSVPFDGGLRQDFLARLPVKPARISLFMRIRETMAGTLVFELRSRPEPSRPGLCVVPGFGDELLEFSGAEGRVSLRRDFKSEQKAVASLFDACPSLAVLPSCGNFSWDGGGFPEVLPLLAEIQDAALPVEWASDRPVRLLRPGPDSLSLHFAESTGNGWFTVDGSFEADPEHVLSLSALLSAAEQSGGTFLRSGEDRVWIRLTGGLEERVKTLCAAGTAVRSPDEPVRCPPASLPALLRAFEGEDPASPLAARLRDCRAVFEKDYPVPPGFTGGLRPYQREGFLFLARMAECSIGCCLADDMGLGKTVELLALLSLQADQGPALVVAPASVCRNWESEAHRFAPQLHVSVLGAKDREETVRNAGPRDVVIASYGLLLSAEELFLSRRWHTVILDEAQNIRNHEAKRSKAARGLQADIRVAATGTPIENRLQDLWSIFDFLNPGMLGTEKDFEARFCRADSVPDSLRRLVSPLILRRLKKDVLSDLPEKTESVLAVDFSPEERDLYEALRRKAVDSLRGHAEDRFAVLAHLTRLRRLCCHPSLVLPSFPGTGSKLFQIAELAENLRESGHRALIFSQFVDFLTLVREEFGRRGFSWQYLDGSTPSDERQTRVQAFQAGKGDFFLISLKAGGTGLNLTGADYVILCDPWWNPAAEDQAADRAHRIGQKNPVTVYRMVVSGTVEEKVLALHERKRHLAETILSGSLQSGVSVDEMLSLLE